MRKKEFTTERRKKGEVGEEGKEKKAKDAKVSLCLFRHCWAR